MNPTSEFIHPPFHVRSLMDVTFDKAARSYTLPWSQGWRCWNGLLRRSSRKRLIHSKGSSGVLPYGSLSCTPWFLWSWPCAALLYHMCLVTHPNKELLPISCLSVTGSAKRDAFNVTKKKEYAHKYICIYCAHFACVYTYT